MIDGSFPPFVLGSEVKRNGEGVEDLIGDENADFSLNVLRVRYDGGSLTEAILQKETSFGKRFANYVMGSFGKLRIKSGEGIEDIEGEGSVVGSDFHDGEGIGRSVGGPEFVKTSCEELTEDRANGNAGHEIALLGGRGCFWSGIVSVGGMIEAFRHVIMKGSGAII